MSMQKWTPDMVRLMRDASEHTDFYRLLAREISPGLCGLRACDAGCGLGYLSIELAAVCESVTAVDVSESALAVLRESVAARGVANIDVRRCDVRALPKSERFDAMVFCLFGKPSVAIEAARGRCKRLIIIKKNWNTRRFSLDPGVPEKGAMKEALAYLTGMGVSYKARTVSLSLDQPFRGLDDAMLFFRLYGGRGELSPQDEISALSRLLPGPSAEFPYMLPGPRELGIITIDL